MQKKKGKITGNIIFLGALGLILSLTSCGGKNTEDHQQQEVQADFLTIKASMAEVEKKYPGAIEGTVNVDVKAQATGYLEAIYVKEGDFVKKGQTLFKLKADVYTEQVSNSKAVYQAALASQATAQLELEKIRPLVEGKVVSELQLQTAEAQYRSATAQVAQAKSALGSSQLNADFTVIKAPVSGYIGRIPNRIGNLVTPNDPVPLTTLSEIEEVLVYFSMSEADFIKYSTDQKEGNGINKVAIQLADGSIYGHSGKLEIASGNIDRSTGSIAMKATFSNPDKLLRSGGSAKIILTKQLNNALLIPMSSVKDIQNKLFVFALADSSKVAMKEIQVEGRSGQNYILKSGIAQGDKIALNSIDVLTDGMPVTPTDQAKTNKDQQ